MEKYGIVKDITPEEGEKMASLNKKCSHPVSEVEKDGEVEFCKKCERYIKE